MSRIRSISSVAALTLVLGACGTSSATVATVNGVAIDASEVVALRASFSDGVTYSGEAFRQDLTPLIFLQAELQQAEADFGLTGLDSDERANEKLANPTVEEQGLITSVAGDPDRTEATLRVVATQLVVREEVIGQLTRELFASEPELFVQVCARHVLVATEEEALAAKERIEAGEDFGAVADDVSLDTASPGGELPCPTAATALLEPFGTNAATAPIGELTGPFQTPAGWHLLIVDDRATPSSVDEVLADPGAWVSRDLVLAEWSVWLDAAVAAADIEVASQVGTWFPEADAILPPP